MSGIEVAAENEEATEAWNGVLYDRWVAFRDIVTSGLAAHGEAALAKYPPEVGDRVLDIGCGLGDTTVRIAGIVGPEGHVHGVDVAERMIETARDDAAAIGILNVSFEAADVQVKTFDDTYDYAFGRMGTMFFASPVAALRNVRAAMVPGGMMNTVVWRRKLDNDWLHRAELVVADYLERNEESDEPTCGPGPFSMANADTVTDVFQGAGFEEVELQRNDIPITIGRDLPQALQMVMAIGPAGEVIRLAGDQADEVRPVIEERLTEALADFVTPEGVVAPASTWTISARNPG